MTDTPAMTPSETPQSRRRLLMSAAGLALAAPLMIPAGRAAAAALVPTPPQTAGPFYPQVLPADRDTDLTRIKGRGARAAGLSIHVTGKVLGPDGKPLSGAVVEVWQCNAHGRYAHPRDDSDRPLDPNFQGYGVMRTDADGGYGFRTVKPGFYPGRTPHIHFKVQAPGAGPLVTQMYFAGEPLNARDGILNRIRDPKERASVIVAFDTMDGVVGREGKFDIVLRQG